MNVPAIKTDNPRDLIKGPILKFDGLKNPQWYTREGLALPDKFLALTQIEALQRWSKDNMLEEVILPQPGEELGDVEQLNSQVPREQWRENFNGELQGPWSHAYFVHLLDPKFAGLFTYVTSTIGGRIAWHRLRDRVQWMAALRGFNALPVVTLSSWSMKTKFSPTGRPAPEFVVIEWATFRDESMLSKIEYKPLSAEPSKEEVKAAKKQRGLVTVEEPTLGEMLNDKVPW
jgi:hypothetical protein